MIIIELVGLALIILVIEVYTDFIKNVIELITFKFKK
jgi:hypothetical protein